MSEAVDIEELQSNLNEYREQLIQVEQLLLDDPGNSEYESIYNDLQQVVSLTEDLLATAREQQQAAVSEVPVPGHAEHIEPNHLLDSNIGRSAAPVAAITSAPEVKLPSVLPPQVAEQIRGAQRRAALAGQAPPEWAIGATVQAVYSADGRWYDGTITAVSAAGNFIVTFDHYNVQEEVEKDSIKERRVERSIEEGGGYKGVQAPNRKKVNAGVSVSEEMPKWLEIKPTDDEKTRLRKRKLIKSFKSKQRFNEMDAAQTKKADAWKSFVSKGTKKKSGLKGLKKSKVLHGPHQNQSGSGVHHGAALKKRHNFSQFS